MYTDKVMDHFSNPRNVGEIEDANGVGEVGNASCGDIMKIFLKVEDDIIKDVKFKTFGCGAAIATSSMVTEMAIGKTLDEAWNMPYSEARCYYDAAAEGDGDDSIMDVRAQEMEDNWTEYEPTMKAGAILN